MKFELKTDNENYLKSFSQFIGLVFVFSLIITLCNVAIKLGIISRTHEIDYNCGLLSVEKSTTNFKKLSKISNLKSKQRIWEFCMKFVN